MEPALLLNVYTRGGAMRNFLLISFLLGSALFVSARNDKLSPDTRHDGNDAVDVIVQFKHRPGSAHAAAVTNKGGVFKGDLSLIKALHISIPANRIAELAKDPEVVYVTPDRQLAPTATTISFDVPSSAVNAPYAWSLGYDGTAIGVAVIDSGTQDAADLQNASKKNRIIYKQSYIPGTTGTVDVYGHGIHVAGLIGGDGQSSNGQYTGVAPNVNILNFRVLNDNGTGQDSYVINAIQAAIN